MLLLQYTLICNTWSTFYLKVVWLKVELCRLLEEKRSALLRLVPSKCCMRTCIDASTLQSLYTLFMFLVKIKGEKEQKTGTEADNILSA